MTRAWRAARFARVAASLALLASCDREPAPSAPASAPRPIRVVPATTTEPTDSAGRSTTPTDIEPDAIASGSAGPDASAAADASKASRRGVFIWDFGRNAPSPERAAELCASWGVRRVFIKNSEGAGGYRVVAEAPPAASGSASVAPSATAAPSVLPTTSSRAPLSKTGHHWADNFSADNLRPFVERGIEVWGFGYFYPDDYVDPKGMYWGRLADQVKASVATLTPDVKGIVVDAEAEFYDKHTDAKRLCAALRAQIGDRKLAYTTFGWLTAHSRFPWKEFDEGCGDAFLPQVYYDAGWPGGALGSLEKLYRDVAAKGLKAPIWPIQSNEWNASVANMTLFFEKAGPDASIFYLHKEGTKQTERMAQLTF